MVEIRLSKNADVPYLKRIWKICFGDDDAYIEFFFNNKYKENQTLVLLCDREIAAMATMIPTKITTPNSEKYNSVMLYGIATDPKYQGKGFSTKIMDYAKEYLLKNKVDIISLVPAEEDLIKFYSNRGYSAGFYIKESKFTYETIQGLTGNETNKIIIKSAKPEEYNNIRNKRLRDKLYVEYSNDEIIYQKKLSKESGGDIYTIDMNGIKGCLVAERINNEKVIIKELLIPENLVDEALMEITNLLPAKEYILRLPAYRTEELDRYVRVFGMIQVLKSDINISQETFGYLGLAYD